MSGAMVRLRVALFAGMTACAGSGAAFAADMPGDDALPPPLHETPPERVEYTSGWYVRGDLAYRFQNIGASSSADTTLVPVASSASINDAFVTGLGAGIKRDWLRLEMTGDYGWRSKYQASTAAGSTFSGNVESVALMGNAYVDLGTWYGLTPYLGAGIGAAYLNFSSYENASALAPMPSTAGPVSRWNFAWAAMAGVSYAVTPNVLVDVGYRHIDMGDISGGPASALTVSKLTGDEIRIGFRYLLD